MSWNYRMVRRNTSVITYGIHEVYYDSFGKVIAVTEQAETLVADSAEDVLDELVMMLDDVLKYPILNEVQEESERFTRWEDSLDHPTMSEATKRFLQLVCKENDVVV